MCGLSFVVVLLLLAAVVRIRTSSAAAVVRLLGGDTECPLQVCQLSRSSKSTHFFCLRRDVALFDSTRAPDGF